MKIDKSYFDEEYFTKGTKSNYGPYQIAEDLNERCWAIAERFKPKRLLDLGCALGFFVAQFRMYGIDAYGIDVSHYAIEIGKKLNFYAGKYSEDKKDLSKNQDYSIGLDRYLFEASATDIPFPDKFFDLVVSWDVLEHIPEKDISKAMSELNRVAVKQYHSIATEVFDYDKDKSHITIKPLEWWQQFLPDAELHGSKGEFMEIKTKGGE